MKGVLDYTDLPLVSIDLMGAPGVVDGRQPGDHGDGGQAGPRRSAGTITNGASPTAWSTPRARWRNCSSLNVAPARPRLLRARPRSCPWRPVCARRRRPGLAGRGCDGHRAARRQGPMEGRACCVTCRRVAGRLSRRDAGQAVQAAGDADGSAATGRRRRPRWGTTSPWQERRANLLVDGFDLPQRAGVRLRIGDGVVRRRRSRPIRASGWRRWPRDCARR